MVRGIFKKILQSEFRASACCKVSCKPYYILGGSNVLNDLYSLLGLEETDFGEEMGWAPTDEGEFWIEFNHRKAKLDDGTVFYILEMPFEPRVNYDDYY